MPQRPSSRNKTDTVFEKLEKWVKENKGIREEDLEVLEEALVILDRERFE